MLTPAPPLCRGLLIGKLRRDRIAAPKKRTGPHHNNFAFLETFPDLNAIAGEKPRLDRPLPDLISDDGKHGRAVILIKNGC